MRLLNTATLKLEDFIDSKRPEYAILSHKWEDDEISIKDVVKSRNLQARGWVKVRRSCEVAKRSGYDWMWIDTCCLDKSNSTELNEAINSMFAWYRDAAMCLTYLFDVCKDQHVSRRFVAESQQPSTWFSRGWTLQELLAPKKVMFYDKDWSYLTTRSESVKEIQSITGIDIEYLCGGDDFRRACIATKMSWMAERTTERKEDLTYALLGILNSTMPISYGEGECAFMRLQQFLLANSTDESLFAWRMPKHDNLGGMLDNWAQEGWQPDEWGLLAPHPKCFKDSSQCFITGGNPLPRSLDGFAVKSEGVQIPTTAPFMRYRWVFCVPGVNFAYTVWSLVVLSSWVGKEMRRSLPLNCWQPDESGRVARVQLYLRRHDKTWSRFKRCRCTEFQPYRKRTFAEYSEYDAATIVVMQPQRA